MKGEESTLAHFFLWSTRMEWPEINWCLAARYGLKCLPQCSVYERNEMF